METQKAYVAQDTDDDAHPSSDADHPRIPCSPSPSVREQLDLAFPHKTLHQRERQQSKWHKRGGKPFQHSRCSGESRSDVTWSEVLPKSLHPLGTSWWWDPLGRVYLGRYRHLLHLNGPWLRRLTGCVPILHNVSDQHGYSWWNSDLPNKYFEYEGDWVSGNCRREEREGHKCGGSRGEMDSAPTRARFVRLEDTSTAEPGEGKIYSSKHGSRISVGKMTAAHVWGRS